MAKKATTLQKEFLREVRKLDGDLSNRQQVCAFLDSQKLDIDAKSWSPMPFLLTQTQYEELEKAASVMAGIMEKLMAKYHRDRTFRKLFNLSPEVEELTLVQSGCRVAVPLARLDVFYDQTSGDFKLCGIMTGGVDGMALSYEAARAAKQGAVWRSFASTHKVHIPNDPVDGCIQALMDTYAAWANAQEGHNHPTNPSLAIVDFAESVRSAETDFFIERLSEKGSYVRATDPSDLRIEEVGGVRQLVDSHGPVTCVWLRPLIDEFVKSTNSGVKTLVEATRHGLVCTVGGYRSWPCCTRSFLSVLRSKECRMLLTFSENAFVDAHLPETYLLDPSSDISRFYDQENWILRLEDSHVLGEATPGSGLSRSAWRNLLVKGIKRRDAVQPYLTQQPLSVLTPIPAEGEDPCKTLDKNVMLGLYVFGGKLMGIRANRGSGLCTAEWSDRQELGCFVVDA